MITGYKKWLILFDNGMSNYFRKRENPYLIKAVSLDIYNFNNLREFNFLKNPYENNGYVNIEDLENYNNYFIDDSNWDYKNLESETFEDTMIDDDQRILIPYRLLTTQPVRKM